MIAPGRCDEMSVEGQGRLWLAGGWHSRSPPSSGNSRCVPALALRAQSSILADLFDHLVGARAGRSRLAFAARLRSLSNRRALGLPSAPVPEFSLPHDSREMDRSTNRFHRPSRRSYSAHMKEAGGHPGLQFGDPSADQDWIMTSTVRGTANLASGSSPERGRYLRRGRDPRSWLHDRRLGHGSCVDRQQRIRCWCRR